MKHEMWRVAALFSVSAIGAGLATGYEWLRFFSYFGSWGTFGLVLAAAALTWLGCRTALFCFERRLPSYTDLFAALLGPTASPAAVFLFFTATLAYGGSMAGDAARVLRESISLPYGADVLLVCGAAGVIAWQRLDSMGGIAGLFLLLAGLYVGTLFAEPRHIPVPSLTYQQNGWWLWHAVLYVAHHFLLALVLLIPLAGRAGSAAALRQGIWMGGGALLLLLAAGHLAILAYWHEVNASTTPFADIIAVNVPMGRWIYLTVTAVQAAVLLGMYLHGLSAVTAERNNLRRGPTLLLFVWLICLFALASAAGEKYRFITHGAVTYTGLACLAAICWQRFRRRRKQG